ncbi:MAG: cytochrome-c peroxidase [Saprospiraceae bacterium]|uniref:cytochrome-c peroxidase n=1 Tax=Candidatus Brachybacter algidus TaxID=2982024 RepID=UPI00257999D5|nr:cytochrome c peroxidase [Candidatus Brachybacter algidus]MBK7604064.1 cytochrome-c peroxidase [Candidatus Brachybacter algidus]
MNKIFKYSKLKISVWIFILITITFYNCGSDELTVKYDPVPYVIEYPDNFDAPVLPGDNALTIEGVKLGKMLFYDKLLAKDGSISCASCHVQANGVSDENQFSKGVEGLFGNRQAMPIFNLAWHNNGFFWDGRAATLRAQSLMPIQDPLEMNESLENMVKKLSNSKQYTDQFIRAFGTSEISSHKVSLALEQFMMTIVSFDSKFDQFQKGLVQLSESEERGRKLFFTEFNPFFPELSGADCQHCHSGPNFENGEFMNNGLDSDEQFMDFGREKVTLSAADRATFKDPSLRNVALTAPYMHDGRFKTLEEVIDHYNTGVKMSSTVSPLIVPTITNGLMLSPQEKSDLIDFLKTLNDPSYLNNKAYAEF